MRNKLKMGLGILLLGAGCFSASVQAEQAQSEAQTQTETSSELPSFLPKDYKVTDTLWGEWGIEMNTRQFDGQPEYPILRFKSGKSKMSFWPDASGREKWESAHKTPFKFKMHGDVELRQINGFVCRGENLKLWFDNGEFVSVIDTYHESCDLPDTEHDAFGVAPDGNAAELKDCVEPVALYKLADLASKHSPVAVTQGKNVLLIKSEDESAIKTYQEKLNPKLHPGFFAQVKRYSDAT